MAEQEQISIADECALGNYSFFQPYNEMKQLAGTLGDVDIYNEEEVQCAINALDRLHDLFWSFFQYAHTALSHEEIATLLDIYHRHLAALKQAEGIHYPVAEKELQCCRNLATCFLGFAGNWYSWFGARRMISDVQ